MTLTPIKPDGRVCFVYCGKPASECHCLSQMEPLGSDFESAIFDDLDSLYENSNETSKENYK